MRTLEVIGFLSKNTRMIQYESSNHVIDWKFIAKISGKTTLLATNPP